MCRKEVINQALEVGFKLWGYRNEIYTVQDDLLYKLVVLLIKEKEINLEQKLNPNAELFYPTNICINLY